MNSPSRRSLSPAKRTDSQFENQRPNVLNNPILQNILTTKMELQMLSKLICPITGLIYAVPSQIHGSALIVESEYTQFISSSRSQMNEASNTLEYLNILYSSYPQLRDVSNVRYVPAKTIRNYQKWLKQGQNEKILSLFKEFRGEFLGNIRLRCKIVKENSVMKTIEKLQKEVVATNKNPGLKWGARSESGIDLDAQKHIVPEINLKHASTYCHWLHELFQFGNEQLILEALDEFTSNEERKEKFLNLLLYANVSTLPGITFFHVLKTCKSLRVVKKLIEIATIEKLTELKEMNEDQINNQLNSSANDLFESKKKHQNENLNMLVIKAIAIHDENTISHLVELGSDINAVVDEIQITPLNYALRKGKNDIALHILTLGADVNQILDMGNNATHYRPLHYAVQSNQKELIISLIDKGARIEDVTTFDCSIDMTPLSIAVQNSNYHTVDYLLSRGASPNAPSNSKIAAIPLFLAVENDRDDIVGLLLSHGAACNVTDTKGRNIVHIAALKNTPAVMKLLMEVVEIRDELINNKDSFETTPMEYASKHQDSEIVRELISGDRGSKIESTYRAQKSRENTASPVRSRNASLKNETISSMSIAEDISKDSIDKSVNSQNNSIKKKKSQTPSMGPEKLTPQQAKILSKKQEENTTLLRERVAQLKKKISDLQSKHAEEVEKLETKAKSAILEARRAKYTVNRIVHQDQEATPNSLSKSTSSDKVFNRSSSPSVSRTKLSNQSSSQIPSRTSSRTPSRTGSRTPSKTPTQSRIQSAKKSNTPSLIKNISVSISKKSDSSNDSIQIESKKIEIKNNAPKSTPSRSSSRPQTPTSIRSKTPVSRSTTPIGNRSRTPTSSSQKAEEAPKLVPSINLFKDIKPRVNSFRRQETASTKEVEDLQDDIRSENIPQRPLSPLVRHSGHSVHSSKALQEESFSKSQNTSSKNLASSQIREQSPTLHRSPSRKLAIQSPTLNLKNEQFLNGSKLGDSISTTRKNTPEIDAVVSKYGDLRRINRSTFSWSIPRSVATRKQFQEVIFSRKFEAMGQSWRLKFYPRGAVDQGMTSLYIMHENGDYENQTYTLEYSVEMINEIVPQQEDYHAKNTFRRGEISWGWSHYCVSNEMLDLDRGFINSDGFIVFHVLFMHLTTNEIVFRRAGSSASFSNPSTPIPKLISTPKDKTPITKDDQLEAQELFNLAQSFNSSYTISDSSDFYEEE